MGEYLKYLNQLFELLSETSTNAEIPSNLMVEFQQLRDLLSRLIKQQEYTLLPEIREKIIIILSKTKRDQSTLMGFLNQHRFVIEAIKEKLIQFSNGVSTKLMLITLFKTSMELAIELEKLIKPYDVNLSDLIFTDYPSYQFIKHRDLSVIKAKENELRRLLDQQYRLPLSTTKKMIRELFTQHQEFRRLADFDPELMPDLQSAIESSGIKIVAADAFIDQHELTVINDAEMEVANKAALLAVKLDSEQLDRVEKMRQAREEFELQIDNILQIDKTYQQKLDELLQQLEQVKSELEDYKTDLFTSISQNNPLLAPNKWHSLIQRFHYLIEHIDLTVKTYENNRNILFNSPTLQDKLSSIKGEIELSPTCLEKVKALDKTQRTHLATMNKNINGFIDRCAVINDNINYNLKLIQFAETRSIKDKDKFYGVSGHLFLRIKMALLDSKYFNHLSSHRLKSEKKAEIISNYLDDILQAGNLMELQRAVKGIDKLGLKDNTSPLGKSIGGFMFGIFHHGYKSTTDMYTSKLERELDRLISIRQV